jgi:hypothetical protein
MQAKLPSVETLGLFIISSEQVLADLNSRSGEIIDAGMLGKGYLDATKEHSFASVIERARALEIDVREALLQADQLIKCISSTPAARAKEFDRPVRDWEQQVEALINKLDRSFKHTPYPGGPRWFDAVIPEILMAFAKMANAIIRATAGSLLTALRSCK